MQSEPRIAQTSSRESESAAAAIAGAAGAYCAKTQRISIVSPHPERLLGLMREMSAACFDMLVFRRLSSLMESGAVNDAYLFDLSAGDPYGDAEAVGTYIVSRGLGSRTLFIRSSDASVRALPGAAIVWPCPVPEAMQALSRLLAEEETEARANGAAGASRTAQEAGLPAAGDMPSAGLRNMTQSTASILRYKDLKVDVRKMTVEQAGRPVSLTKTEYDLLVHLLEEQGAVVPRQAMMNRMWGSEFAGGSNAVDVHIRALRHKLSDKPVTSRYIVTVRGVGYRMADIR